MVQLVTIPFEVANAIEEELAFHCSKKKILTFPYGDYSESSTRYIIQNYRKDNFDTLVSALYIGYKLESPEENLRNFYDETVRVSTEYSAKSMERVYYNGMIRGTEYTLKILGIKIEGVNA